MKKVGPNIMSIPVNIITTPNLIRFRRRGLFRKRPLGSPAVGRYMVSRDLESTLKRPQKRETYAVFLSICFSRFFFIVGPKTLFYSCFSGVCFSDSCSGDFQDVWGWDGVFVGAHLTSHGFRNPQKELEAFYIRR